MNKVVILGDSLGMPREELLFEETYPYLLQHRFLKNYQIISQHKRANDTKRQLVELYDVELYKPNIVILHLGIVDCAPRLFYRKEKILFSYINKIVPIIKIMSKHRFFLTKYLPKVYVNEREYEKNILKIIYFLEEKNIKIILVGIATTNLKHREKSFSYDENINNYNSILEKIVEDKKKIDFIDMYQYGEDILLEDGHHLNAKGSKILATKISQIIKDIS